MNQENRQGLPTTQNFKDEQCKEHGDFGEYASTQNDITVDDEGLLRYSSRYDLPVIVPKIITQEAFRWVHGS